MSPAGLEPVIRASERPQSQDLDRATTGFGSVTMIENLETLCDKMRHFLNPSVGT
jgi:hypothetical protein